ncbi:ESX secretion-associated protein EspG [Nocardia brasiliensis]|uniref:ESX secretion-associated protein EspG n=1 Tax=Nocardia brasiliensis TaxID=37326 RepID=UPI0018944B7A|nr:ESX secretion-associated protein EspG [Nocardia brasiliensis]MBF6130710.1 ESX secretion-associated protein EspG [Nocardia brasiliensis]
MRRTWNFSDIEFVVLWEEMRDRVLPRPFVFTSRIPYRDDYLREKLRVRERLRHELGHSCDDFLESVAHPDIRIIVNGRSGRDPDDPEERVRVLGVRRGEAAYVMRQLPGETVWHSGGFTAVEQGALSLADAVVAALPKADPGELGEVVLASHVAARDDMDYSFGRSYVEDRSDEWIRPRSHAFLGADTQRIGEIEISQGSSKFGPRGITRRTFRWRDLANDGRYLITTETPPVAKSVDAKQAAGMINGAIADIVRAIKEERG